MPWYFPASMYLCGKPRRKAAGDIMRAQKKSRVKQESQTSFSLLILLECPCHFFECFITEQSQSRLFYLFYENILRTFERNCVVSLCVHIMMHKSQWLFYWLNTLFFYRIITVVDTMLETKQTKLLQVRKISITWYSW